MAFLDSSFTQLSKAAKYALPNLAQQAYSIYCLPILSSVPSAAQSGV
jgi:hypothetical protein